MTGYLERLVQRHAAPPAVRPRAVSRFEGDLAGPDVGSEPAAPGADGSPVRTATGAVAPAAAAIVPASAATPLAMAAADDRADPVAARHPIDGPRPLEASLRPAPAATTPGGIPGRPNGPSDGAPDHGPARMPGPERPTVAPVTIRRADPPTLVPTASHAMPTRRSASPPRTSPTSSTSTSGASRSAPPSRRTSRRVPLHERRDPRRCRWTATCPGSGGHEQCAGHRLGLRGPEGPPQQRGHRPPAVERRRGGQGQCAAARPGAGGGHPRDQPDQPVHVPGHAEPGLAQRRPSEPGQQRRTDGQPAAGAGPPLPRLRLRGQRVPRRDPAGLCGTAPP